MEINNILIGAIDMIRKDNTPENQRIVISNLLNGKFIVPVLIDKEDILSEDTVVTLKKGANLKFQALVNLDNDEFLAMFTSIEEFLKWKDNKIQRTVEIDYYSAIEIVLDSTNAYCGFVINPFSTNFVVNKEMITNINNSVAKMDINKPLENKVQVKLEIIETPPTNIIDAVTDYCKKVDRISKAFIFDMQNDELNGYLIAIENNGDIKEIRQELEKIVKPILEEKKIIMIMPITQQLHDSFSVELIPFYTKD